MSGEAVDFRSGLSGMQIKYILLWVMMLWWPATLLAVQNDGRTVALLELTGAIGPASADYFSRALQQAQREHAQLIIVRMDTPGGLDSAMRTIIQDIITSPLPVVSFVAPGGARAASAGTYILYASHVAAMAPGTNVGAATPVQISGFPPGGGDDGARGNKPRHSTMERKIINDAVAYIRGLAQMRGRNVQWAEQAVRSAASLSAEEALAAGVIDLMASDVADLLHKLDGRRVMVLGQARTLKTRGLQILRIVPDWRARLLAVITDPNVAYMLMLLGIYGLIFELASPGMILPGVAGAISLLLALFAFQVLPVNYTGLTLMLLGIAFMVGEIFVTSFGALGIGGVIAFVIGSIMLLDTGIPGYGISIPLIGLFALMSAGFFMLVIALVIRARRRPVVSGMEALIGSYGEALDDFEHEGRIRIHGESWRAYTGSPVQRGDRVRVVALEGLLMRVEPEDEHTAKEKQS